jgi:hypothetical protein
MKKIQSKETKLGVKNEEHLETGVVSSSSVISYEIKDVGSLKSIIVGGAELAAGAVTAGKDGLLTAVLRGVQGIVKEQNFDQLRNEITRLREVGKIKEDFITDIKSRGFCTFHEVLRMIDSQGVDDDEKLDLMKRLFFYVIEVGIDDEEEMMRFQLFQIAKKMTANDMMIVSASYKLFLDKDYEQNTSYESWALGVSKVLGFGNVSGLVELSEDRLTEYKLLGRRTNSDMSGIALQNKMRLTPLGFKMAELLSKDPFKDGVEKTG